MRDFFSQAVPEPHISLGVLLQRFSLGHVMHLGRIQSPFINGGDVELDDLVAAVFICAQTWEDNEATLRDGCVDRQWGPFGWREPIGKFQRRWQRKAGPFNFRSKVKAFEKYLKDGGLCPHYSYKVSDMRPVDCPEVELVYLTLKERLHLSESEIHNRPWGRCRHDYVALRAMDGHVRLEGDMEAAQAAADEFHARYAAN